MNKVMFYNSILFFIIEKTAHTKRNCIGLIKSNMTENLKYVNCLQKVISNQFFTVKYKI